MALCIKYGITEDSLFTSLQAPRVALSLYIYIRNKTE